jgi:hypothetical protein
MNTGEYLEGTVYICHLDPPLAHARHYTGHAGPGHLAERLADHGTSRGARLLQVQRERGGSWHLARTLPGGRDLERAIKDAQAVPRYCPDCTPAPRVSLPEVTPRLIRRAGLDNYGHPLAEQDKQPAGPAPPRPAADPADRGARSAERFLAEREGQDADTIRAAYEFVTGPYRENGPRTPAAAAEMAAFTARVDAALEQRRTTGREQAAPAAQPQEGTPDMSTDTAAGPQAQSATEWQKGAQTAHDLIIRQAEAGHGADHIAAQWEGALATYDDAKATPEQREWHAGAKETAADMVQTLREMEQAEAEQAQAARETQPEPEFEAEAG